MMASNPRVIGWWLCLMIAACLLWPAAGLADEAGERTISVTVVEVAGGRAFIEPGEDAGLRVGQTVRIGRRKFKVVGVTGSNAVIDLGKSRVSEGDRGKASVTLDQATESALERPPSASTFENQWAPATVPAARQVVEHVPIGVIPGSGGLQLTLIGTGATIAPLEEDGRPVTHMSLGARVQAEPWTEVPFGFDADVAASLWLGRGIDDDLGANSRPYVSARELRLRYGSAVSPWVGLGRLRYAASTVGLLDGVRLMTPSLSGVQVAAFGGFVPDPLDGRPDMTSARFGVEASYHALQSSLRPMVHLVAHGSRFEGALDERRVSTYARVHPGPVSLMAHAELSFFDSDNPWNASTMELSAAGVDASWRHGGFHAGARVDMRTPERSRHLASLLPPGFLCTANPQQPELCIDERDAHVYGMVNAGVQFGRFSLAGGATTIASGAGDIDEVGGFVDARVTGLMSGRGHIEVGAMSSRSPFLGMVAGRVGAGTEVFSDIEVSAYYRPAVLSYTASVESWLEHRVGAELYYALRTELDVMLTLETTAGPDVSAVGVFTTAVWRPRFR